MTELASPQRPSTEPPSPRSPGTSVQEYLDNDARPVPAVLRYDISGDEGRILDRFGKPVEGARVEIWQCDALH